MHKSRGGQLVRRWLRIRTQSALAEALSAELGRTVRQSTVSKLAKEQHMPRGDLLVALARVIGAQPQDWFEPPAPVRKVRRRKTDGEAA